jgi:hypothetical protein
MTARRRFLILAVPTVAVVALICGVWLCWQYRESPAVMSSPLGPRTSITLENAKRLQSGMTLAQVEAILGPARREGKSQMIVMGMPLCWETEGILVCLWFTCDGVVAVDGRGQAYLCQVYVTPPPRLALTW